MTRFTWGGWSAFLWVLILWALTGQDQAPTTPEIPIQNRQTFMNIRPWDGITILFNADDPQEVFENDLQQAIEMGTPGIQIQVSYFTADVESAGFPVFDRRSPQPEQLLKLLKSVADHDLTVTLHPILLIQNPASTYWRGQYTPVNEDRWWSDYRHWMETLADIAQSSGTDLLFIGSELTSLQKETTQWKKLIGKIRQRYTGLIGYSANWDRWQSVSFHSDLDVLGLNGYFPLSSIEAEFDPTPLDLQANLLPHLSAMKRWTESYSTPLIFTEVGYPAHAIRLDRPWEHRSLPQKATGKSQRDGFRSFLQVFSEAGPQKGIYFYALHGHDPKTPSGYTPSTEETRKMWTDYFRERRQP